SARSCGCHRGRRQPVPATRRDLLEAVRRFARSQALGRMHAAAARYVRIPATRCKRGVHRESALATDPAAGVRSTPVHRAACASGYVRRGASAIQCCYAATERRESSTLTDTGESKNANVTLRNANKSIVDEKISLNVSRLVTNPACMAGVLSSRPNFSAL